MSTRDPFAALREADERLRQVQVPSAVEARVKATLERVEGGGRLAAPVRVALAGAAALALVVVGIMAVQAPPASPAAVEPTREERRPVEVSLGDGGRVEEREGAFVLVSGSAIFDVRPRAPGEPPVVVRIGDARIEVMGTRFVVTRREREGHVRLERGAIRVVDGNGAASVLAPGDERTFALEKRALATAPAERVPRPEDRNDVSPRAEPRPPTAARRIGEPGTPDGEAPRRRAPAPAEVDTGVARVAALRSAGDDQAALVELDRLLALELDPRTAETLSFEKGLVLERIEDARECAHWSAHRERFAGGRYDDAVARARERLSCEEP